MNLPNKLTLTRILLVPVFMIFASLTGLSGIADGSFQPTYYLIAGIVFAAASFTDFLDGHLARTSASLPTRWPTNCSPLWPSST